MVVIAVVVVATVAAVVQRRRVDDYEHTITRVQVEARAVGDGLDLSTFPARAAASAAAAGVAPNRRGPGSAT